MSHLRQLAVLTLFAGAVALPVMAQQPPPGGVVATTNNPNLAVATLKLESGVRVSKIVGAPVYNDANEKVGTIDDVILTQDDRATMAIVSIGGFLGVGSKLVAFPYAQLKREPDKVTIAGATKDSLAAMPGFSY